MTSSPLPFPRLAAAGAAAIAAAVIVNVVLLLILRPLLGLDPNFMPFSPGAVAFFTLIFTFLGWVVYLIVNRLAKNPRRVYLIVSLAALVISQSCRTWPPLQTPPPRRWAAPAQTTSS